MLNETIESFLNPCCFSRKILKFYPCLVLVENGSNPTLPLSLNTDFSITRKGAILNGMRRGIHGILSIQQEILISHNNSHSSPFFFLLIRNYVLKEDDCRFLNNGFNIM